MIAKTPQTRLGSLGPKSSAWVPAIGIRTRADLETLGAIAAHEILKQHGYPISLNLVYDIEGELRQIPWSKPPDELIKSLRDDVARIKGARISIR